MAARVPKVRLRFIRSLYAPGGTIPLEKAGEIEAFPIKIAQGLIDNGYARRLNEEELKEFHHERAVRMGKARQRRMRPEDRRALALLGVAARQAKVRALAQSPSPEASTPAVREKEKE